MGRGRILMLLLMISIVITQRVECKKESESPQYTVIHTESDFEIRFYRESAWMTATMDEISFEKAYRKGFHRLFQFTEGANLNSSRLPVTYPVVTSIVPDAGPLHSSAYIVKLYLPTEFQADPPVPMPSLNLQPDWSTSHCIATRQFSGFARDNNIVKEAEKLASSLSKTEWANSTYAESGYAYSIAQYDSVLKIFSRVNEVWVDVGGSESNRCKSSLVAAY